MKRLLMVLVLALAGCESVIDPEGYNASQVLNAACQEGDVQACAAIRQERAAEAVAVAIML